MRLAIGLSFSDHIPDDYDDYVNDRVTEEMSKSSKVEEMRAFYYKKYANQQDLRNTSVVGFNGNFGITGYWHAGVNPIQQFVGSFRGSVYSFDGKTLWFYLTNRTSFNSFTYDVGPSWSRSTFPVMGNIYQNYIWNEPINRSKK